MLRLVPGGKDTASGKIRKIDLSCSTVVVADSDPMPRERLHVGWSWHGDHLEAPSIAEGPEAPTALITGGLRQLGQGATDL